MIGVIVATHGKLALGFKTAVEMFFGDNIEAIEFVCLDKEKSVEEFHQDLKKSIENLDSESGTIVFTDLYGGTPCNQTLMINDKNVKIVAGINLSILMEFLALRSSLKNIYEVDFESLIKQGREALQIVSTEIENMESVNEEL